MKYDELKWSLKVWLTTSIVSAILFSLLRFLRLHHFLSAGNYSQNLADEQYQKLLAQSINMVCFSLVILIPFCITLYYLTIRLGQRDVSNKRFKLFLSIAGALLIVFPFALIICYYTVQLPGGDLKTADLIESIVYCVGYVIVGLVSVWCYKLKYGIASSIQSRP